MIHLIEITISVADEVNVLFLTEEEEKHKTSSSGNKSKLKQTFSFHLQSKQNEYLKIIRGDYLTTFDNEETQDKNNAASSGKKILCGLQFQTNLGRRSPFFRFNLDLRNDLLNEIDESILASNDESSVNKRYEIMRKRGMLTRYELLSQPGLMITGCKLFPTNELICSPVPQPKKTKLRTMVMSSSVLELTSKQRDNMFHGGTKSVVVQAIRSGIARKLLFSKTEGGENYIKLILENTDGSKSNEFDESDDAGYNLPPSVYSAILKKGNAFTTSLFDLLSSGRERHGRPPIIRLMFEKTEKTASNQKQSSIIETVFKNKPNSLASMILVPNRDHGLRSIIQLITDEEGLDDKDSPSVLRMMTYDEEEGKRPSLLRLMLMKNKQTHTSLVDELLMGENESNQCLLRTLLGNDVNSIARLFLTDTCTGKPCLAKYAFGEKDSNSSSLFRLMLQGEARNQFSLMRCVVIYLYIFLKYCLFT